MYLVWKDKNKLEIKGVSHKRTVSSKKKTTRQLTKFFILQNEPELKRCSLYHKNTKH